MKLSIGRRILLSFLFLTTASLSFLGIYLLHFFYQKNLETATAHLITNARIVETRLGDTLSPQNKSRLQKDIVQISNATHLRITLLEPSGTVIADSWESIDALDNHLDRLEIQNALRGQAASAVRYSHTIAQNMLYAAIPIYHDGKIFSVIRTASTLEPIEANYEQTRNFILSAIAAAMALTVAVSIGLAHRYTKPLKEMTQAARRIAEGRLEQRLQIHTGDEFEILAHTINQLTGSLQEKIIEINAEAKKSALILQNMDNAVILLDANGNITAANQCANELFQITPDLIGRHSVSVIGDSAVSRLAQEVLHSGHSRSAHLKLKAQHTTKTFQVFFAPINHPDGTSPHILSVFHDISVLQEIYDRQVDFVANASHELATPLTSIRGFSETLLDGALKDPKLCRKFIAIIHTESERMSRLVKDLLQLAKLDTKEYRRQIPIENVAVKEIFAAVENKLLPSIEKKKQSLQINLPDSPVIVSGNYDWILQLMINLTENAVKYTPEGGQIRLSARAEDRLAHISVQDSGSGIAPQDLPFIFDRFYRADKARSRAAGGSGIGLSLARFIAELFGGKLTAASQLGCGATFTCSLPLCADADSQSERAEKSEI